jgi:hypothetical protein
MIISRTADLLDGLAAPGPAEIGVYDTVTRTSRIVALETPAQPAEVLGGIVDVQLQIRTVRL